MRTAARTRACGGRTLFERVLRITRAETAQHGFCSRLLGRDHLFEQAPAANR
jgi:hypothetical protein